MGTSRPESTTATLIPWPDIPLAHADATFMSLPATGAVDEKAFCPTF